MKIVIQGYPGCFHEEAARRFFQDTPIDVVPAASFVDLAKIIQEDNDITCGIMAIENSIAGSILQNYRILREGNFWIKGEIYHRIVHNLMAYTGQTIEQLFEVHSHPMAINQCLQYFRQYRHIKLVESEDTALSAMRISEENLMGVGAIASQTAADIYNLEVLASGIETSKVNYTRFFIIQKNKETAASDINKASIYLHVPDKSGSLLRVLEVIHQYGINMSKLQSYPVLGKISEYFFHIDLEVTNLDQFQTVKEALIPLTISLEVLGLYQKANVYDYQTSH